MASSFIQVQNATNLKMKFSISRNKNFHELVNINITNSNNLLKVNIFLTKISFSHENLFKRFLIRNIWGQKIIEN